MFQTTNQKNVDARIQKPRLHRNSLSEQSKTFVLFLLWIRYEPRIKNTHVKTMPFSMMDSWTMPF